MELLCALLMPRFPRAAPPKDGDAAQIVVYQNSSSRSRDPLMLVKRKTPTIRQAGRPGFSGFRSIFPETYGSSLLPQIRKRVTSNCTNKNFASTWLTLNRLQRPRCLELGAAEAVVAVP